MRKYTKIYLFLMTLVLFIPIHRSQAYLSTSCSAPPIVGDWNGNSKTKTGIFSNGSWYLDQNGNGTWDTASTDTFVSDFGKGLSGAQAISGDWNSDGKTEIGVYYNGSWYFDLNGNGAWDGASTDVTYADFGKGLSGAQAVIGDWNGNGKPEVGVYYNGSWYLNKNGNGAWDGPSTDIYFSDFGKGLHNAQAVVGDWNGDGKTEIGIYNNGAWYLDLNGNGIWDGPSTDKYIPDFGKGLQNAQPVIGDWNGDGHPKIGVYVDGLWYLDLNGNGVWDGIATDTFIQDFGKGINICPVPPSNLGLEISVGLWGYDKSDISNSAFQIDANKGYNIRDDNGNIIAQVSGSSTTKVKYDSNGNLKVYNSIASTLVSNSVTFDATDGDNTTIIFNTHRSNYISNDWRGNIDHYRGKIKAQYYHGPDVTGGNTGTTVQQVWIDNILPLEQYVWGAAETTGTGPMEHTKVMTTMFRTYGFWYIKYANKYTAYGFKIRSDSGSQNYGGYDWETNHPNIKTAAQATRGIFATYSNDVALTPYSSWSDGKTRSFEEVWGSKDYPWCISVSDPYGKNSSMTTAQLQAAGNHMVGLIANGSLNLAGDNYKWTYDRILKYYYTGISLPINY